MAKKIKPLKGKHIIIIMLVFFSQVFIFAYITKLLTCSDDDTEGPIEEKFRVSSVVCEKCAQRIKDTLELYSGIIKTEVDIPTKTAYVTYDPNVICRGHIDKLITLSGYNADDKIADKKAFEHLENCCKTNESLSDCITKYNSGTEKSCCEGNGMPLRKK